MASGSDGHAKQFKRKSAPRKTAAYKGFRAARQALEGPLADDEEPLDEEPEEDE